MPFYHHQHAIFGDGEHRLRTGISMKLLIGYVGIVGTVLFLMLWGVSHVMTQAADNEERDRARVLATQSIQDRVATDSLQRKRKEAMDRAAAQAEQQRQASASAPAPAEPAPSATTTIAAAGASANPGAAETTITGSARPERAAADSNAADSNKDSDGTAPAATVASNSGRDAGKLAAEAEDKPAVHVSPKKPAKSRHVTRKMREARAYRYGYDGRREYRDGDDGYDGEFYERRRAYRPNRAYRPPFAPFDRFVRGFEIPLIGED
jgi:hypothetical protein